MDEIILPIQILAEQFAKLPGVGKKTALKYAFSFVEMKDEKAEEFAEALLLARSRVFRCNLCKNYSEEETCPICSDEKRDRGVICVVEDARSIVSFERAKSYKGLYHVLGGVISPIKSIGPEKLNIKALEERVQNTEVREVILATNPTLEGETTAMYITGILKRYGVKVSRLAYGIPAGGDLEYTDEVTLSRAIEGRQEI
jgi:recombination protein RecR